jgi:hypothetical protein
MATKTFSSKFIANLADNQIGILKIRDNRDLRERQRQAIHNFRQRLWSRWFRENWTDTQIIERLISHTKRCISLHCKIDYPIASTLHNTEISQLRTLRRLAEINEDDLIVISDTEWKLLIS